MARTPELASDTETVVRPRRLGPTPRYRRNPNWGLPVGPAPQPDAAPAPKYQSWALSARGMMRILVWVLVLAVLAEALRYGLLLWNQSRLVWPLVAAVSDAASLVMGVVAPLMALVAAIGCAAWLVRARAAGFAEAGWRDPRSARSMFLGSLVPVWNLVMPGVYLTELSAQREPAAGLPAGAGLPPTGEVDQPHSRGWPRTIAARLQSPFAALSDLWLVRCWWGMWVLTNVTVAGTVLARLDWSAQGRANGVLFTLYANVLALAVAGLTIKVMARLEASPAEAQPRREPARWLIEA